MAAGITYNRIASTTSTGSSSQIVFNSISQSYTDLVIVISGTSLASGSYFDMQFNTDTSSGSTNYSFTRLIGFSSTVYTDRYSNFFALEPSLSDTQGTLIINLQNYSNTTTYKNAIWRLGNMASGVEGSIGLWRNTSAISTITFKSHNGNNLPSGTIFTIYGIAAA